MVIPSPLPVGGLRMGMEPRVYVWNPVLANECEDDDSWVF